MEGAARLSAPRAYFRQAEDFFILFGTLLRLFATLGAVAETVFLQGRVLGLAQLTQVRQLLAAHPDWSRYRLSREVARSWDWRNPLGQLKDMAARSLLLKLEQRGWIELPPRRWASPNRMRHKRMPALPQGEGDRPVIGSLDQLRPLAIQELSGAAAAEQQLFAGLLHRHHYLSYRSPVGENLQYLVRDQQGRPLACLLFGAAAWHCGPRDRYVGWDAATRQRQLHLLANNSRFLVLPWVQVSCLGSHLLGRVSRHLSRDWHRKYGHPIYLLETFVERDRFAGTCYQAANWRCVGQTQGRTRQDRPDGQHHQVPIKDIYLYALHPRFREHLQGQSPAGRTST